MYRPATVTPVYKSERFGNKFNITASNEYGLSTMHFETLHDASAAMHGFISMGFELLNEPHDHWNETEGLVQI